MARCSVFGGCLAPTTLLLVVLTLLVSSTVAGMLHFCQYVLRSIDDCFRFVNLFLKLQRCDPRCYSRFWIFGVSFQSWSIYYGSPCNLLKFWSEVNLLQTVYILLASILLHLSSRKLHTLSVCSWIDFLFAISTSLIMYLLSTMSPKQWCGSMGIMMIAVDALNSKKTMVRVGRALLQTAPSSMYYSFLQLPCGLFL